MKTRSSSLV